MAKSAKLEMLFIISQAAKNFKNNSTFFFLHQNHSENFKICQMGRIVKTSKKLSH